VVNELKAKGIVIFLVLMIIFSFISVNIFKINGEGVPAQ